MIYLFYGGDSAAKQQKMEEIKAQCLTSNDALKFDYELLHAFKLDSAEFKKALVALPAVAQQRLVLIRSVEKLSPHNKKILLEFMQAEHGHVIVILDTDETDLKNSFFDKVSSLAKVVRSGKRIVQQNVFDMTRAMEGRNASSALKTLNDLLEAGESPLKIMGALVWFWGKSTNRLSGEGFKKGLLVLQEADLNIKRSRIKPEHAVEIAVTKLSSLLAC